MSIVIVDLYSTKEFHFSINTIISYLFKEENIKLYFLGYKSHIDKMKSIHENLNIRNISYWKYNLINNDYLNRIYIIREIIYLINLIYSLYFLKSNNISKIYFIANDLTIFPLLILILDYISPIKIMLGMILHKPISLIKKKSVRRVVWKHLLNKNFFYSILLDDNSSIANDLIKKRYILSNKFIKLDVSMVKWPIKYTSLEKIGLTNYIFLGLTREYQVVVISHKINIHIT